MIPLAASSNPQQVDRYQIITSLVERAVLTRSVCSELLRRIDGNKLCRWRTDVAYSLLMKWVSARFEDKYCDALTGLDQMHIPSDCQELLNEIRDGSHVCKALAMLHSADTDSEYDSDLRKLDSRLSEYWKMYPETTSPPPLNV